MWAWHHSTFFSGDNPVSSSSLGGDGEHLYLYPSQCITLRWRWRMGSFPSSTVIFLLFFRWMLGRASFASSIVCRLYRWGRGLFAPPTKCIAQPNPNDPQSPPKLEGDTLWIMQMSPSLQSPPKLEGDTVDYANEPLPPISTQARGRHTVNYANEPLPPISTQARGRHCGLCK